MSRSQETRWIWLLRSNQQFQDTKDPDTEKPEQEDERQLIIARTALQTDGGNERPTVGRRWQPGCLEFVEDLAQKDTAPNAEPSGS
ncbi:hypothetical protein O181_032673 [Austropuccinia psidii MF-1]|uniref:Uncharacterized protein n=1 Tax=Austropuccinia psidii MF-1 TaxID=1389203 RepID=A0A9Q3D227_9BASI|nr:hypothetical protein [Austropuccinia psidii MF-1]